MGEQIRVKRGIRWKLLTTMIGLIVGLIMTLTFIQITYQKNILEKELVRRIDLMKKNLIDQGKLLSDNLARQTEEGISSFNFSYVTEIIKKTVNEYKEISYIILMDSSRVAYTHTLKPELQQERLSANEDKFAVKQRKATIHEYAKEGNSFMEMIVPIKIGTKRWGVLRLGFSLEILNKEIVNSRGEIRKKIADIIIRSLITSALFIAIGAGIVFIMSTRLSKPLIKLTESARELAKGDFDASANIKVSSKDEVGILAASFGEMAKNLKTSYEKLEDYSRTLEQKVEDRTRQLREANEKLREMDKVKSDFLSTVSHELRTPLTSVLGFAKIIKKRFEEVIFPHVETVDNKTLKTIRQVKDNIDIIISEGERLTTLINDVLDLTKIEAGKVEWKMEYHNIDEIVKHATTATLSLLEQKGLQLIQNIEDGLPDVRGDKNRLIQVMINLISNAVKFTEKGSVTCSARRINNEIIVSVIDTGIGIAKIHHERIFEKFKQVGDTLTDKPRGTGLGLPICRHIIINHGGRIWVESEPGKGSNFSFTLPIRKATEDKAKTDDTDTLVNQVKNHVVTVMQALPKDKKNILVVDDDAHIRELLRQALESEGYNIKEAKDGIEAISEAKKEKPDLIILDIMMPEINGFDVAAVLKNDTKTMDIPIVINSIIEDKERGYSLGVDRYFTKPIKTEELVKEVGILISEGASKKKVIVIDENETMLNTLYEVLKVKGYSIVETGDGHEEKHKETLSIPNMIIVDTMFSKKHEIVKTINFKKEGENVLFLVLAENKTNGSNKS